MITFRHKGDFSKTINFLNGAKESINLEVLNKYGQEGVAALASATPVDSGETAKSWYYRIRQKSGSIAITFFNSNIQTGVLVAVLVQYGHATRNGGWVEGQDYINPAIKPIFDKIANEVWREVTKK